MAIPSFDKKDKWITWDGTNWRAFKDEDLHESRTKLVSASIRRTATGLLDPAIMVVTLKTSQHEVAQMHAKWRMQHPKTIESL